MGERYKVRNWDIPEISFEYLQLFLTIMETLGMKYKFKKM